MTTEKKTYTINIVPICVAVFLTIGVWSVWTIVSLCMAKEVGSKEYEYVNVLRLHNEAGSAVQAAIADALADNVISRSEYETIKNANEQTQLDNAKRALSIPKDGIKLTEYGNVNY